MDFKSIVWTNIMKCKKTRHDMICKKCKEPFKNVNNWHLCYDCFVEYENKIPDHIPKEQHINYLIRTIKEKDKL